MQVRQAGHKRGLCWTFYNEPLDPSPFNAGNVVAIYDYETTPPVPSAGGLAFIGMQRCLDCDSSPIADLQTRYQQQQWATVFTLNEPDINGISPQTAATWYIQNINPLPIKKALPAVTSSTTTGQGLSWLSEFITACNGQCFFDYINLHYYGPNFEGFQQYVRQANAQFPNNQLVITEFALTAPATQADQIAFYQQAIPFLDNAAFVDLYFPFVATSPSLLTANDPGANSFTGTGSTLFNDDGSVSAVGQLFI